MYKFKIRRLEPSPGQRILVTSDIHGHYDALTALLDKANFGGDDLLIIAGDMLEKGADSLPVLRYIMELQKQGRAVPIMGNMEYWRLISHKSLIDHPENAGNILRYLRGFRQSGFYGTSFFDELCRELELFPDTEEEVLRANRTVLDRFSAEFAFLEELPTLVWTPEYIFVHGGLPDVEMSENITEDMVDDPLSLMKYDRFLDIAREKKQVFKKYVVCGHWPVNLYTEKYSDLNPIIDRDTRIISIDGGCGLKWEGQLNMLIFPSLSCSPDEITHISYDGLPVVTAKTAQAPSEDSLQIRWGDAQVRLLAIDGDTAQIEHIRTGRTMWVPSDYLYSSEDSENFKPGAVAQISDCSDYRLPVCPGDALSVIRRTSKGLFAKKDGISGWYTGEFEG